MHTSASYLILESSKISVCEVFAHKQASYYSRERVNRSSAGRHSRIGGGRADDVLVF
ncbi:hypothetical protein PUN4_460011 [Paraburkholderia unamae]|nr:hypothetical protein PUN4_460011 [Paraburkholderia unamae]